MRVGVKSAIHRNFQSCVMCGSMGPFGCVAFYGHTCKRSCVDHPLWSQRLAILTLEHVSNVGCSVVNGARLCPLASALRFIVLSFAATKRSEMRRSCRRLYGLSMGICYPKLVCRLSCYVFRLVTRTSSSNSNCGHLNAPLSFICLVMNRGYSMAGTVSVCSSSHQRIRPKSSYEESVLVTSAGKVALSLPSVASGLCVLLRLYFESSSSPGFGVVHKDVIVRGMPFHIVSQAGVRWH